MPPGFGFFAYAPPSSTRGSCERLVKILERANSLSGSIHGVILPESALTSEQHQEFRLKVKDRGAFLICGIGEGPSRGEKCGKNYLAFDVPSRGFLAELTQGKHHRWLLSEGQIKQYGLGSQIASTGLWWEHISVGHRSLAFASLRPFLTISALICEDLARQDPVAELLRAVGPNLVVALLMDGPQLSSRWPARYATVLAEDPGASVLTLTSIGMALMCVPEGCSPSRVIALWKDARGGLQEITLPLGAEAVALRLKVEYREEWSADGRGDGGSSANLTYMSVDPVTGT